MPVRELDGFSWRLPTALVWFMLGEVATDAAGPLTIPANLDTALRSGAVLAAFLGLADAQAPMQGAALTVSHARQRLVRWRQIFAALRDRFGVTVAAATRDHVLAGDQAALEQLCEIVTVAWEQTVHASRAGPVQSAPTAALFPAPQATDNASRSGMPTDARHDALPETAVGSRPPEMRHAIPPAARQCNEDGGIALDAMLVSLLNAVVRQSMHAQQQVNDLWAHQQAVEHSALQQRAAAEAARDRLRRLEAEFAAKLETLHVTERRDMFAAELAARKTLHDGEALGRAELLDKFVAGLDQVLAMIDQVRAAEAAALEAARNANRTAIVEVSTQSTTPEQVPFDDSKPLEALTVQQRRERQRHLRNSAKCALAPTFWMYVAVRQSLVAPRILEEQVGHVMRPRLGGAFGTLIASSTRRDHAFPVVTMQQAVSLLKALLSAAARKRGAAVAEAKTAQRDAARAAATASANAPLVFKEEVLRAGQFIVDFVRYSWVRRRRLMRRRLLLPAGHWKPKKDLSRHDPLRCPVLRCRAFVDVYIRRATATVAADSFVPLRAQVSFGKCLCDACARVLLSSAGLQALIAERARDEESRAAPLYRVACVVQSVLRTRRSQGIVERRATTCIRHVLRQRHRLMLICRLQGLVRMRIAAKGRCAAFTTFPDQCARLCSKDGARLGAYALRLERCGIDRIAAYLPHVCTACREVLLPRVQFTALRRYRAACVLQGWWRSQVKGRFRQFLRQRGEERPGRFGRRNSCKCAPVQSWLRDQRLVALRTVRHAAPFVCLRPECMKTFNLHVLRGVRLDQAACAIQCWYRWHLLKRHGMTDTIATLHGAPHRSVVHRHAMGVCRACFPLVENFFRRLWLADSQADILRPQVVERYAVGCCELCVRALAVVLRPALAVRRQIRSWVRDRRRKLRPSHPLPLPGEVCPRATCRAAYLWLVSKATCSRLAESCLVNSSAVAPQLHWLCPNCSVTWGEAASRKVVEQAAFNGVCRMMSRCKGSAGRSMDFVYAAVTLGWQYRYRTRLLRTLRDESWRARKLCTRFLGLPLVIGKPFGIVSLHRAFLPCRIDLAARAVLELRAHQQTSEAARFILTRAAVFACARTRWLRYYRRVRQLSRTTRPGACVRCDPVLDALKTRVKFVDRQLACMQAGGLDLSVNQICSSAPSNGLRDALALVESNRRLRQSLDHWRSSKSAGLLSYAKLCCNRCRDSALKIARAQATWLRASEGP
jgi:hypothetical protein